MSWDEVKKAVNSDLGVPLNHLIWLNDYKTYGENSYVFQDKDVLHELYKSSISSKDNGIFQEALSYFIGIDSYLGMFIKNMFSDHKNDKRLSSIDTMYELVSIYDPLLWIFTENGDLYNSVGSNANILNSLLQSSNLADVVYDNAPDSNTKLLNKDVINHVLEKKADQLLNDVDKLLQLACISLRWTQSIRSNDGFVNGIFSYANNNFEIKTSEIAPTSSSGGSWGTGYEKTITPSSQGKRIVVIYSSFKNPTGLSLDNTGYIETLSSDGETEKVTIGTSNSGNNIAVGDESVKFGFTTKTSAGGHYIDGTFRSITIKYFEM